MRILATLHAGLTRLGGVIQWLDGTMGWPMRHACGCGEIAVPDVIVSRDHMHQPLRALRKERAYLTHQDERCGQMLPFSNFGSCSELWGGSDPWLAMQRRRTRMGRTSDGLLRRKHSWAAGCGLGGNGDIGRQNDG